MSGGGGGGGAGGGLITDANARLLVEEDVAELDVVFSDTDEQPVIDWTDVTVTPPVLSEGDSLTIDVGVWHYLEWGEQPGGFSSAPGHAFAGDGPVIAPHVEFTAPIYWLYSWGGYYNQPHTGAPCGIGPGAWVAWLEREIWRHLLTIPEYPAGMAGIYVDVQIGGTNGYAPTANVMVLDEQPSIGRQGVVVGTVPGATTKTIFIPRSRVPTEGGQLWIGLGPTWQANYDLFGYQCGTSFYNPVVTGQYNSGRMQVMNIANPRWVISSETVDDLGTTVPLDEEESPYEGGNDIEVIGMEGSPVISSEDGTLTLEGPGGYCVGVVGDREDEEQPEGVWGDPWAPTFRFSVDAIGSGEGQIVLTTTRPGLQTVGTIHLGDTDATGITVAVGAETATADIEVTPDDIYQVRFDDRSDYFRGKLWRVSDGEPTDWSVEVPLPEEGTEDVQDRFVWCIRADSGQTITVYPLMAAPSAPGGWIREKLGIASGSQDSFLPSHRYRSGSLEFELSGLFAPPSFEDGRVARLDYHPTRGMTVWVRYLAD